MNENISGLYLNLDQSFACPCELCKAMIYLFLIENKEIHRGQEAIMAVSYNRLWKLLIDRKISKADLRKTSGIAPNTMTKLRQSGRYANSRFKWVKNDYSIRFAYEATDKLIRFTDYKDIKYRSRSVYSFHRPETLFDLLQQPDTIRNNMKHFPPLKVNGFAFRKEVIAHFY